MQHSNTMAELDGCLQKNTTTRVEEPEKPSF
jgi:hypothetical protein